MLSDTFLFNLTTKYRHKNDRDLNKVFKDDLINFVDICPEDHLEDVYNFIPTFHKYSTPFDVYKIKKYATEKGYIKKRIENRNHRFFYSCKGFTIIRIEELDDGSEKKHFDHISCNTRYSFRSTGCPNCHSSNSDIVLWSSKEGFPDDVIFLKEDCHRCINFSIDHAVNRGNDVHGPTCENYGQKNYPNNSCGTCKCKNCCQNYRDYILRPWKYTHTIKANNADPMPWIGKNLAVSLHVRDESRLTEPTKNGEMYEEPGFFGEEIPKIAKSKRVLWSK